MHCDARRFVRSVLLTAGPLACAASLFLCLFPGSAAAQQPVRVVVSGAQVADGAPPSVAHRADAVDLDRETVPVVRRTAVRHPDARRAESVFESIVFSFASGRPGPAEEELGSLGDFLPDPLCRDLLRLRTQVQDARRVLFGQRGIVRLGKLDAEGEKSRVRLNLQYSPDPGIRFTLVTP